MEAAEVPVHYPSDLTNAQWAVLEPLLPQPKGAGRRPTIPRRRILNGLLYLERTGCQWRLLPREFPAWGTVYYYFRTWKNKGVWTGIQQTIYEQVRKQAGRSACPSVIIKDGPSGKTTESP